MVKSFNKQGFDFTLIPFSIFYRNFFAKYVKDKKNQVLENEMCVCIY